MTKKCKDCGAVKDQNDFYGVQGECKECSRARIARSSRNILKKCAICGSEFGTCISEINRGGGRFCSRACWYKNQRVNMKRGSESHAWKGGVLKDTQGYTLIYKPSHDRANSKGYVFEHILVIEEHLGRSLKAGEVVHHINENKSDNSLDNLMLFPSTGAHTKYHWVKRRKK